MMMCINRMSCSLLLTLVIVATYCRAESIAIDGGEQSSSSHSLLRQQKQTVTSDYTGEYYCNIRRDLIMIYYDM